MKKYLRLSVLVFAAVFVFAACDSSGDDDNSPVTPPTLDDLIPGGEDSIDKEPIGATLKFTEEQVYVENDNNEYEEYDGENFEIRHFGQSPNGAITGGKFTVSMGTPTGGLLTFADMLERFEDYSGGFEEDLTTLFTNLEFDNKDAQCYFVSNFYVFKEGQQNPLGGLSRVTETETFATGSAAGGEVQTVFIYVDSDVTFSGKGKTTTPPPEDEEDTDTETITSADFSIELAKGWNAVYLAETWSATFTGSPDNAEDVEIATKKSLNLGNPPGLKWRLNFWDNNN